MNDVIASPVTAPIEVESSPVAAGEDLGLSTVGLVTVPGVAAALKATAEDVSADELMASFSPKNLKWSNANWSVIVWMSAMHLGALAAPFFFSWSGLAIAVVLHWFSGSIGICLGFHRLLSHRSLKLAAPARFMTTLAGVLAGEGSPLQWAATHRLHHARSDQPGDPHSPLDGPFWSHAWWLFVGRPHRYHQAMYQRYVPDLVNDPMLQFFEKTYGVWLIGSGVVLYALGEWYAGVGLSWLLWGLCLRIVMMYHSTWFVNSATHIWGYRNYETRDMSRNLWWVAVLAYGEGWHNNHHAHPRVCPAGHRWWEFDMTYWSVKLLRSLGLAYDVVDRIPQRNSASTESQL